MSGRIVRAMEKTDFNWGSSVTNALVITAAAQVVNLDVSASRETVALIRVHSFTFSGSGGALTLNVYADAPTSEDPGIVFRDTASPLVSAASIGTAAGTLYRAVCTNPGGWITIVISATQGNSTGSLKGTLSIDLSLKD